MLLHLLDISLSNGTENLPSLFKVQTQSSQSHTVREKELDQMIFSQTKKLSPKKSFSIRKVESFQEHIYSTLYSQHNFRKLLLFCLIVFLLPLINESLNSSYYLFQYKYSQYNSLFKVRFSFKKLL